MKSMGMMAALLGASLGMAGLTAQANTMKEAPTKPKRRMYSRQVERNGSRPVVRKPDTSHRVCRKAHNTNRPKKLTLRLTRKEMEQYSDIALALSPHTFKAVRTR